MTDRDTEVAHARAALSSAGPTPPRDILGAVHTGLLAVPAEHDELSHPGPRADPSTLAARRR